MEGEGERVVASEFPMKLTPLGKHDAPKRLPLCLHTFFILSVFRDFVKYVESKASKAFRIEKQIA